MFNFNLFKKSNNSYKVTAIIMAAGSGTRMNIQSSKQLVNLIDKPLIAYSLLSFQSSELVNNIIIVAREQDILAIHDIVNYFDISKVQSIIKGGNTRQQSVKAGLFEVGTDADIVAIHDGARPCITVYEINKTIEAGIEHSAAAIGCKVTDTLKLVEGNKIIKTVDRENLWQIQTPQVFKRDIIQNAHTHAEKMGIEVTDDTSLLEVLNIPVYIVEGSSANIKVTTKDDLLFARGILESRLQNGI